MQNTEERLKMTCPLNGKICIGGRREDFSKDETGNSIVCRWWVHLFGKDPQSEKVLDQFDCAVAWIPTTSIEGAQMTRQLTATLDAHRSEMRDNFSQVAKAVTDGLRFVAQHQAGSDDGDPHRQIENNAQDT